MIEELDVVVLTTPLPAYGLEAGDSGTVVDAYPDDDNYTVEFTRDERTVAIAAVHAENVRVVWRAATAASA